MRGILFLILASALLMAGCVDLSKVDTTPVNETNGTAEYPRECSGPVCGTDGQNYPSDCAALDAGAEAGYPGQCIPECSDSDGGIEPDVNGVVSVSGENASDYCIDASLLLEYSCLNGTIDNSTLGCGEGRLCELGRCIDDPTPPGANETNETGITVPDAGCHGPSEYDVYRVETVVLNYTEYTDTCVDYKVVKDYYCQNGSLASINNECDPGYGCMMGKCEFVPYTCVETDGGNDTLVRGRTTVSKGIYTGFNEMDECIDDGRILEHMCLENGSVLSQELLCGNALKCFAGKCLRSDCDDSDGGYNLYERGTVKVRDLEDYRDECMDEKRLREYYCYGDDVDSTIVKCEEGFVCNMGECEED